MANFLVVDDSMLTRKRLGNFITNNGHNFITAANGREALTLLQSETPDGIFLDLLMPVMDGFELLKELKNRDNTVPVIVVSADIQESTREKVLALSALDIISKPGNEEVIAEGIALMLGEN